MVSFLSDEPLKPDLSADGPGPDKQDLTWLVAKSITDATRRYQIGSTSSQVAIRGPLTIAVYGPWGSGKTTLLRHLSEAYARPGKGDDRGAFSLWFEPWRYEREENLIIPLLTELTAAAARSVSNRKTKDAAVKTGMKLLGRVAKASARTAAHFLADRVGLNGDDVEKIGEDFLAFYEDESGRFSYPQSENEAFREDFEALVNMVAANAMSGPAKRPVCIFIDDLDRCSPEQVRRLLESMKNFLWVDGVTYVLALDREQVTLAIAERRLEAFRSLGDGAMLAARTHAKNYLEKFFLYTFDLDDSTGVSNGGVVLSARATFWRDLEGALSNGDDMPVVVENALNDCKPIYDAASPNLRRLKRMVRWLYYELTIEHEISGENTDITRLASRFSEFVISENYPELWLDMLADNSWPARQAVYALIYELLDVISESSFDNEFVVNGYRDDVRAILAQEFDSDRPQDTAAQRLMHSAHRLSGTSAGHHILLMIDADDTDALFALRQLVKDPAHFSPEIIFSGADAD